MAGAVDAGYLDELVPADAVETAAIERARQLGPAAPGAYAFTKARLRQALADEVLAGIDADMDTMVPPG